MQTFLQILATNEVFQFMAGAMLAFAALIVWNVLLERRLRRLTRGTDGKNLETHIASIARDYQDLEDFKKEMREYLEKVDSRLKTSTRGIGLVRFNPFAGSGASKPSFAVAFVSENGDGLVISTLHAHNSVSIFSKTIKEFESEQELSGEEAEALEKAKDSLHT